MTEFLNATNGSNISNPQIIEPFRYNEAVEVLKEREYPMLRGKPAKGMDVP